MIVFFTIAVLIPLDLFCDVTYETGSTVTMLLLANMYSSSKQTFVFVFLFF